MTTQNPSPMGASPLQVSGISKRFKKRLVLDDISFNVKPGEIFGLIGMNGVGKTTIIKIMLDLLKQDAGDVHFFGTPNHLPASRKHIAYLPEKFYPSQFLKGREFLSLAVSFFGKPLDMAHAEIYAKTLELDPSAFDLKISKYSKGMGQKLGLLSVFLSEASLLILDEPMTGLDPGARIELKDLLLQYRASGKSIFFSSHILSDIEEICDRMAVLHDRKLLFIGKPSEFRTLYAGESLERSFLRAVSAASPSTAKNS